MGHLEFVNQLSETGVSIRSTSLEFAIREVEVHKGFNDKETVLIEKNTCKYKSRNHYGDPLKDIISKAIDMDSWKHSWHTEIVHDNYGLCKDIIQKKILDRAKEIEELLAIYFVIPN